MIEANPVARWPLTVSPWLALGAAAVWAGVFTLVVRYCRHGTATAFLFAASHTIGVSTWLIRLGWPGWIGVVVVFVVIERTWTWCRSYTTAQPD